MRIKEEIRERKVPRAVEARATIVAEVGAIGIAAFAAVLGFSRVSAARKIDA